MEQQRLTQKDLMENPNWIAAWEAGLLRKVVETFTELKLKYPGGSYSLKLSYDGAGALVFENAPPLGGETEQKRAAVDFEDGFDIEQCLEQFKVKVAALYR